MMRNLATLWTLALLCVGPSAAMASCSKLSLAQVKPAIDSFLLRPDGLLDQYPRGGIGLIGTLRTVVASDMEATTDAVLGLLKSSNNEQKRDIGTALGGAARQCKQTTQAQLARKLMTALRNKDDRVVMTAFMIAFDDSVPPDFTAPVAIAKPTNPLGLGYLGSPDVDAFKKQKLPDPFAPVK